MTAMKRYIGHPRVEGTASRQAHADLPPGTYEREMSKEGFFGPAALLPPPPPADRLVGLRGPARARTPSTSRSSSAARRAPWSAPDLLHNASTRIRFWRTSGQMDALARNADGDELLFVHAGRGDLYCDFGRLRVRAPATTSCCRAARCGASSAREPAGDPADRGDQRLATCCRTRAWSAGTRSSTRRCSTRRASTRPSSRSRTRSPGGSRSSAAARSPPSPIPYNPLDAIGWHGDLSRVPHQRARHPPADEPPLPPAAVGAHDLRRQPLRRLHLRAAAVRDRPGRDQDPVLPQQRRLRRGHLLPRGRLLQPRQHPPGHGHPAPERLHARPAPEGAARACWCSRSRRPTSTR